MSNLTHCKSETSLSLNFKICYKSYSIVRFIFAKRLRDPAMRVCFLIFALESCFIRLLTSLQYSVLSTDSRMWALACTRLCVGMGVQEDFCFNECLCTIALLYGK